MSKAARKQHETAQRPGERVSMRSSWHNERKARVRGKTRMEYDG
jgi:hypothetical protein